MLTNESRVCFNTISVMRWHQILPRFSSRQNSEFRNDYGFLCILLNPNQSICHAWKPTDHQVEARYDLICLWVDFNSSLCIFILNIYHLSLPTGSHLNVSYTHFGKRKKNGLWQHGDLPGIPRCYTPDDWPDAKWLAPISAPFFSQIEKWLVALYNNLTLSGNIEF